MSDDLDAFSERQLGPLLDRWNRVKKEYYRRERQLWLGTMVANFTDHELGILSQTGVWSPADGWLLQHVRKGFSPNQSPVEASVLQIDAHQPGSSPPVGRTE